jgi:hypothetical protein
MATEKDIKSLEARIEKAMKIIQTGEQTPKETDIGKMLNSLKDLDLPAYEKAFEAYKPISKEFFDKYYASPEFLKKKASEDKKLIAARKKDEEYALSLKGGSGGNFNDDDVVTSGPRNHNAKELKPKKQPKVKIPKAQKPQKEKGDRDRSGFVFLGETYGKGPLVLAVIREHVRLNPKITCDTLKKAFPDELLKGYGIFQTYEKAMEISKVRKRFFLNDNQLVRLKDKNIAICNQFSSDNIMPFLSHTRKLGYKID